MSIRSPHAQPAAGGPRRKAAQAERGTPGPAAAAASARVLALPAAEPAAAQATPGMPDADHLLPGLQTQTVAVGAAREHFASYIRRSAEAGEAFLIRNGRSASAPTALLISPQTLAQHLAAPRPRRTLGEIVDSLPFRRRGVPRLTLEPLPDGDAPELVVATAGAAAAR